MATVGLALALADLACLRLPDPLVAASAAAALGLVPVALAGGTPQRLLTALAGAAVSFAAYVLLALLPGSRLGFGDVKLAAALGLPLGWLGWPALGLGLLLPHLLNGWSSSSCWPPAGSAGTPRSRSARRSWPAPGWRSCSRDRGRSGRAGSAP